METAELVLRDASDGDGAGLIALIGGVFAEYPGCVFDLGEMPDLLAPASALAGQGGRLWVVELDGRVVASIGCVPVPDRPGVLEIVRLYVAAAARRRGLGARLVGLVEAEAARRGCAAVDLWTDTRFTDAHRLYERLGYVRQPGTRTLDDLSRSVEYNYVRRLG